MPTHRIPLRHLVGEELRPSPPRVVLAEDNHELRRMLSTELRKGGFLVREAATGFELLEQLGAATLHHESVDLIVTDVRMPGLTGLHVIEGLRNRNQTGSWATPIILITAFPDAEVHVEAQRLGAHVLDKPFELEELLACALRLAG